MDKSVMKSLQRNSAEEKYDENKVRERGGEIHDLKQNQQSLCSGFYDWYHWLVTFVPFIPISLHYIFKDATGNETSSNGKHVNDIGANGTTVNNQCYHWENPAEHTHFLGRKKKCSDSLESK